jgi:hypothetical protein
MQRTATKKETIDKDWYVKLLEFNKDQNITTAAFVRVNETFKDFHFQMHGKGSRPEFQEPSWSEVRSILPGSMVGRAVLGSALVTIDNVTYEVFRESVQPFNFSFVASDSISFITPTWDENLTDENGYALVEIRASAGPRLVLSDSVFYTESCPSIGWVGSGLSCRLCPEGTYGVRLLRSRYASAIVCLRCRWLLRAPRHHRTLARAFCVSWRALPLWTLLSVGFKCSPVSELNSAGTAL